MNSKFRPLLWLKSKKVTHCPCDKMKKKKGNLPLAISIHVEDIKSLKPSWKPKASTINRAQRLPPEAEVGKGSRVQQELAARKNIRELQKILRVQKIFSCNFLWVRVIPLLSTTCSHQTLCNQGIFSINNIFRFKYLCYYA